MGATQSRAAFPPPTTARYAPLVELLLSKDGRPIITLLSCAAPLPYTAQLLHCRTTAPLSCRCVDSSDMDRVAHALLVVAAAEGKELAVLQELIAQESRPRLQPHAPSSTHPHASTTRGVDCVRHRAHSLVWLSHSSACTHTCIGV